MKFGITCHTGYHGVDPDNIIAYAKHAEDSGFESFYLPEHVVLYPGAMLGSTSIDPALSIVDPLECLAFVAAATERIVLGTGVLQLPYHHPVILAKRLATIDVLSKGRMRLLTVGLGSLPGEADAVGVDFATRGRRADEAIDVLRLSQAAPRWHPSDPRRRVDPGSRTPRRVARRWLFPGRQDQQSRTGDPDRTRAHDGS